MTRKQWLLLVAIVVAVLAIVAFDPARYLNLAYLQQQQAVLHAYVAAQPVKASLICVLGYTIATALSIPGAFAMTLAAGAVFGLLWGTVLVSFASTIGATIAFLMSRYLFRGLVQARFGHRLQAINRGVAKDGPMYLLTLRLIPLIPFIGINLLMALTPISARNFYLYSQIGMLPATMIFVNAGTQLSRIEQVSDIASPTILISLGLLAAFPLITHLLAAILKRRRFLRRFPPPPAAERNVIVIGAGSGGLVASLIASSVRAKVTLIEADRMGGDCLNSGCVPSKALLRVARQVHQARHASRLGLDDREHEIDFERIMQRVQTVIERIEPHDSVERYSQLGVECLRGHARIVTPWEVEVNGQRLSTRAIVLATGARPLIPELPGLDQIDYLTTENLWSLQDLPARLLVLGGGPIGCELAQAFARLGSAVTLVEMAGQLLPREDAEVAELLGHVFNEEGITVHLHTRAQAFSVVDGARTLHCETLTTGDHATLKIEFDRVLLALGRAPNVSGYGLEELGLVFGERGTLEVNDYLQTELPNIYACGDVAGPYQFTHTASHQAWYATVNALFGEFKRTAVDYRVIPWCTFTAPEVARVGLNEREARERGVAFESTVYDLEDLDRAIADGAARGFVKVLTARGSDRILGATIVGEHGGEMISEFILAMKHGLGLGKLLGTIHIYPTWTEANKHAAGAWRRAHSPQLVLDWLERFHRWRRGDKGHAGKRRD